MKIAFYQKASGKNPIEDFILGLPKADQARFAEVFDGIEKHGLSCPRIRFRQLQGKLWEIKFNAVGGGYRIAYVMIESNTMVWLHAFKKKTQKTPAGDLELAEKRMKEVLGL
ncbi:MAG TPA: type II toxin-antitoxin system RelE/ParE family toxin [Bacteriovoracaceae bacterium]|nr:type II toxin-antitoxin system RelE/ParE family toxin [Bacteriovoracaceae bacterium]